jgi:uncharacterized phage protein gp47/JayE
MSEHDHDDGAVTTGHTHADDELKALPFDGLAQMMVDYAIAHQEGTTRPLSVDDFGEGSVGLAIFEGVAGPLEELMYAYFIDLPAKFFMDEAEDENLDRIIENFTFGQVKRVPASTAAGLLVFEGEPGAAVTVNAQFRTPDGTIVKTLFPGEIAVGTDEVTVAAQAVDAGAKGNLVPGTELSPIVPITGITRVFVRAAWSGGADKQSNEELRDATVLFLESLSRGTRGAIYYGAVQAGYPVVFIAEPGVGQVWVYVDDGTPVSSAKLAATKATIGLEWRVAGAKLKVLPRVDRLVPVKARIFNDGTVNQATLEAAVLARWQALFAGKRQKQGLNRLELVEAIESVPGYNGINLAWPETNLTVRAETNEYGTTFGPGDLFPYEKVALGAVTFTQGG